MMIVLVGMIGCCANGALVLVMIVVMIVVKKYDKVEYECTTRTECTVTGV